MTPKICSDARVYRFGRLIRNFWIWLAIMMLAGVVVGLAVGMLGLPVTWRMGVLVFIVLVVGDRADKFQRWAERRWPPR